MAADNSEGDLGPMTSAGKKATSESWARFCPEGSSLAASFPWGESVTCIGCLTGQGPLTSGLSLFIPHSCQHDIVNTLHTMENVLLIIFNMLHSNYLKGKLLKGKIKREDIFLKNNSLVVLMAQYLSSLK